jgi:hypothetical protein
MICKTSCKDALNRLRRAVRAFGLLLSLAALPAFGQQVFQLSFDGSNWTNQNLGSYVDASYSGMGAFVTTPNNQRHVYYPAPGNFDHVHQLFFNGVGWSDQDLTVLSNGAPAEAFSGITGFSVGNYQYVYFVSDGYVHQLLYDNYNWTDTNITAISGTQSFANPSSLVAFTTTPALHVYYPDFDQHLHQLFATNGTNWQDQDLTNLTGGTLANAGYLWIDGLSIGNYQYVYIIGADNHLHQFVYNNSGWSDQDLTVLSKTPNTGAEGVKALVIPGTRKMRVYYQAYNGDLIQLSSTDNAKWTGVNLTKKTKAPPPSGFTGFAATVDANNLISIFYASGPNLYRVYQLTASSWSSQNMTALTNGPLMNDSQMVGFSVQGVPYVYYDGAVN